MYISAAYKLVRIDRCVIFCDWHHRFSMYLIVVRILSSFLLNIQYQRCEHIYHRRQFFFCRSHWIPKCLTDYTQYLRIYSERRSCTRYKYLQEKMSRVEKKTTTKWRNCRNVKLRRKTIIVFRPNSLEYTVERKYIWSFGNQFL